MTLLFIILHKFIQLRLDSVSDYSTVYKANPMQKTSLICRRILHHNEGFGSDVLPSRCINI